jgi:hypothetical protein
MSNPLHYEPALRSIGFRRWLGLRFARWHAWTAALLWLGFTVWTLLIVLSGLDHAGDKPGTVAATTTGTVLGPMTGAISREFQGCCVRASVSLLPYCGAGLVMVFATQLLVLPRGPVSRELRVLAWTAGLFVWFGGGIASFLHALS